MPDYFAVNLGKSGGIAVQIRSTNVTLQDGSFFRGLSGRGVTLTTLPHLIPRLKKE